MKKFYLTTPLYYVNDLPHIGHSYTTIAADILARWKRLLGFDVFFLTGTDEHGTKIAKSAQQHNMQPLEFADMIVEHFKRLWQRLNITYDDFIRTTETRHTKIVQQVFEDLIKKGLIYKGKYSGWYCVPCETYLQTEELSGKNCPNCGREVELIDEDTYYFRLSIFQESLKKYFKDNPDFFAPSWRAKEMLNFLNQGLKDISFSRTKVRWAIPSISDPHHTIYVWIDALLNYITAINYGCEDFFNYWPADVHFIGKEILRFHTIIWPAILIAINLPPPKKVFAHGWWTVEGEKMSKSKGNIIDPNKIIDKYSSDVIRYFLFSEVTFGEDGDFSYQALVNRYNSDLADNFGNLVSRLLNMIETFFNGEIDNPGGDEGLIKQATNSIKNFYKKMEDLAFTDALGEIFLILKKTNQFIESKAPWNTIKTDKEFTKNTLYQALAALKTATIALHPFIPDTTTKLWQLLAQQQDLSTQAKGLFLQGEKIFFSTDIKLKKCNPLFPK